MGLGKGLSEQRTKPSMWTRGRPQTCRLCPDSPVVQPTPQLWASWPWSLVRAGTSHLLQPSVALAISAESDFSIPGPHRDHDWLSSIIASGPLRPCPCPYSCWSNCFLCREHLSHRKSNKLCHYPFLPRSHLLLRVLWVPLPVALHLWCRSWGTAAAGCTGLPCSFGAGLGFLDSAGSLRAGLQVSVARRSSVLRN